MTRFEYSPIKRPLIDARSVQALVRQDVDAGGFPNPETIADPNSPLFVLRQRRRILRTPDNYTGVYDQGELKAFMKTGNWNIADQIPFSSPDEVRALEALVENGQVESPQNKLGIFGLVVTDSLPDEEQGKITERLLDIATDRALHLGKTAVNIIFHDHDIVSTVALSVGFEFTNRVGIASGAPGLTQSLYSKPLDL